MLPFLREQTGQSTANLGIVGATIVCLIWAMALLSGVDLQPGLSTLYHATEPVRQQIADFIAP